MTKAKIAITLPRDQLRRARAEVKAGRAASVSGYISGVLAKHQKRDSLRALLARLSQFAAKFGYFRPKTAAKFNACNKAISKMAAVKTYPLAKA